MMLLITVLDIQLLIQIPLWLMTQLTFPINSTKSALDELQVPSYILPDAFLRVALFFFTISGYCYICYTPTSGIAIAASFGLSVTSTDAMDHSELGSNCVSDYITVSIFLSFDNLKPLHTQNSSNTIKTNYHWYFENPWKIREIKLDTKKSRPMELVNNFIVSHFHDFPP